METSFQKDLLKFSNNIMRNFLKIIYQWNHKKTSEVIQTILGLFYSAHHICLIKKNSWVPPKIYHIIIFCSRNLFPNCLNKDHNAIHYAPEQITDLIFLKCANRTWLSNIQKHWCTNHFKFVDRDHLINETYLHIQRFVSTSLSS